MALQYFIYPYFIPYFPFFSTVPIFSLTELNSSLAGIDIRLNTTSNQPEWSARGAGSWSPFSGKVKGVVMICTYGTYAGSPSGFIINTDGSSYNGINTSSADLQNHCDWTNSINIGYGSGVSHNITVKNEGYYAATNYNTNTGIVHLNAGDNIKLWQSDGYPKAGEWNCGALIYLGETNPFE